MRKELINLQLFDDSGAEDTDAQKAGTGDSGQKNTGTAYSYEQAEEIANARAEKAQRAALADYFRKQGMSEEQITDAIADYKAKQKASQSDVSAVERERDEARRELEEYKNTVFLQKNGVREEDLDYVMFKVAQMMDEKTDFTKAAQKFLKENPKYTGKYTYRITTSTGTETNGSGGNTNSSINNAIRAAIRR